MALVTYYGTGRRKTRVPRFGRVRGKAMFLFNAVPYQYFLVVKHLD